MKAAPLNPTYQYFKRTPAWTQWPLPHPRWDGDMSCASLCETPATVVKRKKRKKPWLWWVELRPESEWRLRYSQRRRCRRSGALPRDIATAVLKRGNSSSRSHPRPRFWEDGVAWRSPTVTSRGGVGTRKDVGIKTTPTGKALPWRKEDETIDLWNECIPSELIIFSRNSFLLSLRQRLCVCCFHVLIWPWLKARKIEIKQMRRWWTSCLNTFPSRKNSLFFYFQLLSAVFGTKGSPPSVSRLRDV